MKQVIFINSHPIQYFAPLYKYMNEQGISTSAWYCSDKSVKGSMDKQFGVNVKWDIPILEGYTYRFFRNHSPVGEEKGGFLSYLNLGIIGALRKAPPSVIVVHGWHYATHLLVILLAGMFGHTVCFRSEVPQHQEAMKKGWKVNLRRAFLRYLVFPRVKFFLFIGSQNKAYYQAFGIPESKLVFCPYAVDNNRFTREYEALKPAIPVIRAGLGIGDNEKVILYSGKYINKKRPMDLLEAYAQIDHGNYWLIMLGEGGGRKEMETFIAQKQLKKVILTGFVNQLKIGEYYAASNLFVMCSTVGETWGLSANEALNFNLPLIISHHTGSSYDLVKPGDNGYVFETGNVAELASKLTLVLAENALSGQTAAKDILKVYNFQTITEGIRSILTGVN